MGGLARRVSASVGDVIGDEKITLNNYTTDKYYLKIFKAVDVELQCRNFVTPIEVFISMGLLQRRDVENRRVGRNVLRAGCRMQSRKGEPHPAPTSLPRP